MIDSMKKNTAIILLAICMTVLGCGKYSPSKGSDTKKLEAVLSTLNETSPAADARNNAGKGDLRYAACLGEAPGPYFPSIPDEEWNEIMENKDYWMIEGTSDALESRYHEKLIQRAEKYAEAYNTTIVEIRSKRISQ